MSRIVGAVTAHPQLGAFRTVRWNGNVLEVTVVLQAKQPLVAPGVVETVPPGWVASVLDDGEAMPPGRGDAVEILWSTHLDPGRSVRVVYALYPRRPGPRFGSRERRAPTAGAAGRGPDRRGGDPLAERPPFAPPKLKPGS